jgi:hypothetical protein
LSDVPPPDKDVNILDDVRSIVVLAVLANYSTRGWKDRDSYLIRSRKLDMEMFPDSLEAGGVNELSVVIAVHESFTTEQTVSDSLVRYPPGKKISDIID